MSYRQSFNKTITIHYSGSVSYPASEHGGTVHYSGTAYEDVVVNVNVNTNPFERSIDNCNGHIGGLTNSVIITEAAQTAAINKNASKVGNTIINGFFKTVRSEISQQISEISNKIDATLIHLNELSKRCIGKQKQMETDYHRIASRYLKIFDELNSELKNRIYQLDKPTFEIKKIGDDNAARVLSTDMVGTVAIAGAENAALEARIAASVTKKKALEAMTKMRNYIAKQNETKEILRHSIFNKNYSGTHYSPVCFIETTDGKVSKEQVYANAELQSIDTLQIANAIKKRQWKKNVSSEMEKIGKFFNAEVANHYPKGDQHADRVRNYVTRLFNNNTFNML